MTIAVAAAVPRSRRPVRRGWRPRYPGEFPTLGWQVLDWASSFLPSPRDERESLRLTDEQARRVLRIYELDPDTGQRLVRRVHEEEAKGWGKGPFSGFLMLAEFRGPVLFDGWDADGQPVGRPWGTGGSPAPWIQAAAVSEAQTANVWTAMRALLLSRDGGIADALRIDPGITRCYATDMPGAFMERVTASAGSREGQPITHTVLDEVQLWTPSNGGDVLARTILRNLTKTGGWAHFTGNAPATGLETVAEEWWDEDGPGVYRFATRPSAEPREDWPDEQKLAALREVYRDVPWMLDHVDRILADVNEPKVPWTEKLRYSFNWRVPGGEANRWISEALWSDCDGEPILDAKTATYAVVTVAHDHRSAAIAVAQRQGSITMLRVRTFPDGELPEGELVPVADLEAYVRGLRERFPAYVMGVRSSLVRGGREHRVALRGPEVTYNGSFFEGSAQKLRREGLALRSEPGTQERLAPASEALKGAVLEQRLVHDGGDELAEQIAGVVAVESANGWTIREAGPAARAAMVAVHRALTAPAAPSRTMHRGAPR